MKQYQDLMRKILKNGTWQNNRTGIRTKMLPAAMLEFDLREGFPAVTTKKLAYRAVVGELIGFLRGCNTVKEFNDLNCKVWDANAKAPAWLNNPNYIDVQTFAEGSSNDDDLVSAGYLGRIYGFQWRNWSRSIAAESDSGPEYVLDQIDNLLKQIEKDPTSRRMIVTAWRPDELDQMALPPCHYSFQVIIEQETKTMHLLWNQRSCDMFLGIPFNIASYATLLHILARITGYNVGTLTGFLADVHIYENHIDQVTEQLSREPLPSCQLEISDEVKVGSGIEGIEAIEPNQINLVNYVSHPAIKADMAV